MLYDPNFEQDAIDAEQSAVLDFIGWLAGRDTAIRHAYVPHLNFDTCVPIFEWAIESRDTDLATIAEIFWQQNPSHYAAMLAAGETIEPYDESYAMIREIIANVRNGFYPECRFAIDEQINRKQRGELAALTGAAGEALAIPRRLAGPFGTETARVPDADTPKHNAQLWDMLYALGMDFGFRPGSEEALYYAKHGETAEQREARMTAGTVCLVISALMGGVAYWLLSLG